MIEIYLENLIAHKFHIHQWEWKTLCFCTSWDSCWGLLGICQIWLDMLFASLNQILLGQFGRININSLFPSVFENFWSTSGMRGIGGKAYSLPSFPTLHLTRCGDNGTGEEKQCLTWLFSCVANRSIWGRNPKFAISWNIRVFSCHSYLTGFVHDRESAITFGFPGTNLILRLLGWVNYIPNFFTVRVSSFIRELPFFLRHNPSTRCLSTLLSASEQWAMFQ